MNFKPDSSFGILLSAPDYEDPSRNIYYVVTIRGCSARSAVLMAKADLRGFFRRRRLPPYPVAAIAIGMSGTFDGLEGQEVRGEN